MFACWFDFVCSLIWYPSIYNLPFELFEPGYCIDYYSPPDCSCTKSQGNMLFLFSSLVTKLIAAVIDVIFMMQDYTITHKVFRLSHSDGRSNQL